MQPNLWPYNRDLIAILQPSHWLKLYLRAKQESGTQAKYSDDTIEFLSDCQSRLLDYLSTCTFQQRLDLFKNIPRQSFNGEDSAALRLIHEDTFTELVKKRQLV